MTWFVLTTAPQMEFKAEAAVRQLGYNVVMPYEERELRKRAGKDRRDQFKKFVLLRRYLVVEAESTSAVGSIVYRMAYAPKRLITGYLGNYGTPSPVPDWAVEYLNEISGRKILMASEISTLKVGDTARIINGPMEGHTAKIESIRGAKAKMFLKWLGGEREITVPTRSLRVDASSANQLVV